MRSKKKSLLEKFVVESGKAPWDDDFFKGLDSWENLQQQWEILITSVKPKIGKKTQKRAALCGLFMVCQSLTEELAEAKCQVTQMRDRCQTNLSETEAWKAQAQMLTSQSINQATQLQVIQEQLREEKSARRQVQEEIKQWKQTAKEVKAGIRQVKIEAQLTGHKKSDHTVCKKEIEALRSQLGVT